MDVPLGLLNGGVGVAGLLVFMFWMLATGRLSTGRELAEKNKRIAALEGSLKERDYQLSLVLTETMTTINPVLKAMRDAADAERKSSS